MNKKYFWIIFACVVVSISCIVLAKTNTKQVLSEVELSKMYGGACYPCTYDGITSCAGPYNVGDGCEAALPPLGEGGCDGMTKTTCKQAGKSCKNLTTPGCTNTTTACTGTYSIIECHGTPSNCIVDDSGTYSCSEVLGGGPKPWCN